MGACGLAGCGPRAELVLRQPFAPPAQQNLKLVSEQVYHRVADKRRTCVLTFPLPGAVSGPRAFVVYLCGPEKQGQSAVDPKDPTAVRGFLIQEVGALAGRTDFAEGWLRWQKVPLAPRLARVELNLRTEDGAQLVGRIVTEEFSAGVQSFEREFAGDVASLAGPASQPAEGEPTRTRSSGSP